MRLRSLDGSMEIIMPTTGMGVVVTIDGHAWFHDPHGEPRISVPPAGSSHVAAKNIHECPACRKFLVVHD